MAKKAKPEPEVKPVEQAMVLSQVELAPAQTKAIFADTPKKYIKKRQGAGGKMLNYVEGGYVVKVLNDAFSPVGWDFKILREWIETNEIMVLGELTIRDHKNGWQITKTQYGQNDRKNNVPVGDCMKAAATDALKKCASLLGVALDVYWPDEAVEVAPAKPQKPLENMPKEPGLLTPAQNRKIFALLKQLDKTKDWFEAWTKKPIETLTLREASSYIDTMQKKADEMTLEVDPQ